MLKKVCFIGASMILLLVILTGCTSSKVEEIEIYHMGSFATISGELVGTLTKTYEINKLEKVFENAEKEAGVVDMAEPHYRIELDSDTYYLWIDDEYGTLMNSKDTHTIFKLTKSQTKTLNKFLQKM